MHLSLILALGNLRQKDHGFEAILGCIVTPVKKLRAGDVIEYLPSVCKLGWIRSTEKEEK